MSFNLNDMVHRHNLDHLDTPFTNEEIMAVIKDMPTDRAPGPDRFNDLFMKKCWDTIQQDFIKLARDFYHGHINLDSINSAYITLIPKVNEPENMNDFWPISLVSLPIKFLTKLLANRLQKRD
jgi:hypothetical protein